MTANVESTARRAADRRVFHQDEYAPPRVRPGFVVRAKLLQELGAARDRRVVSIVAPPGFGKTTILAQWARSETRPVAWLTVGPADNDPAVLFTGIATSLDRLAPLDATVFDAILPPDLPGYAMASRLLASVSDPASPVLLMIDDAHGLTAQACLDALGELIARIPAAWQVALAGRDAIAVPLARWRAEGSLLDVGPRELALGEHEVGELVREQGLTASANVLRDLLRQSGGWPAVVYLQVVSAARSPEGPNMHVSAGSSVVTDYLRSELLERRSAAEVRFLIRTSILDRLSGPVCDAVMGRAGSAALLSDLARSTLLIDDSGGRYRYHSLLREFLGSELERREPGRIAELHARASRWFESEGDSDAAVEHAFASGDLDRAAEIIGRVILAYHWSGRRATVRAWIERFDDDQLVTRPWLAVLAAIEESGVGDVRAADRLANIVEHGSFAGRPPDGTASFESGRAMLRALMCRSGAADATANAARAVELEPVGSPWRDLALWALSNTRLIAGDLAGADMALADTVAVARANGNFGTWQCALAQRSLLAMDRGAWAEAVACAEEAAEIIASAHIDGYQITALARAALARIAAHRGEFDAARAQLAHGVALRPTLTATLPWLNVAALIELARAYLAVGDPTGARTLLVQAGDVVRLRPDLGVLPLRVKALHADIASLPIGVAGPSSLTASELRVLAFLPLYLSFKEIGQRLGVKASTVQTHATAIYGKLGASSRSEAVDLAVAAGLLEGSHWLAASHIAGDAVRRDRS